MRRLLMLVLIAIVCSGCGTFRKVFKSKESHSVKVEQSATTNTTTQRVDKSITTITERIDTTIVTPGNTVGGSVVFNMDSLANGLTAIKNDLIDVTLHLNPITGVLSAVAKIKPVPVNVQLDKTTTVQNDITEQSNQSNEVKSKAENKDSKSTVHKEPAKMGIWLVFALVVFLVVGAIVYWMRKR